MTARWYVVFTKPRLESHALENLAHQGFEAWCPRARMVKRRAAGRAEVTEPLFPRYAFVRLVQGEHVFSKIRSTRGCVDLVKFGNEYRPLPDGFIEALRNACDADGILQLTTGADRLKPGAQVRLCEGAMAGLVGELLSHKAADRVVVLMNVMGHHAQVEVALDSVEVVS